MKKTIKQPLVSVIMPVHNAGNFVAEAIESIVNQTYKNLELIIVDDGSSDQSTQTIKNCQKQYPKTIHAVLLRKNIGESASANLAFKQTKGDFIARMDADDISHPERIEKQVEFMLSHPEIIVLGTQADVINEKGEITGKKTFPSAHRKIYSEYAIFHPMLNPSCMVRRSLLPDKNKLYENKLEPNDDYYTFFKLLNHGKFANLEECLVYYRIHSNNKSLQNPKEKFANSLRIRKEAIKKLGYKAGPRTLLFMALQYIIVTLLPERLIVPTYIFLRGMYSPSKIFDKIFLATSLLKTKLNISLSRE